MSKPFTALAPAPLINLDTGVLNGFVNHGAVTSVAFTVNHSAVVAGTGAAAFEVGQTITSTSGGTATIAAVNSPTQIVINSVVGVFAPSDTLTQTTGPNTGATATQSGSPLPLGFQTGETITSSSGGSATIGTPTLASQTTLSGVTGLFTNADLLTQTTGLNAGATANQTGEHVLYSFGPFNVRGFLNGRLRGNAHQDVAGVMLVEFGTSPTNMDLDFTVDQDIDQADFQYPFDVIILAPYIRLSFTNGGAAAAFFRANAQVLPI